MNLYIMGYYIMKATISTQTKYEIVKSVVVGNNSIAAVATQFNVSPTTVRRYKAALEQQVLDDVAKANELAAKQAQNDQAKPQSHRVSGYDIPLTKRGGRARNGRSAMFYSAIGKFGIDAPSDKLYNEVNRLSVESNLSILNKATFSAMLSEYKAIIRKQQATATAA